MNTERTARLSRRAALVGALGLGAGLLAGCQKDAAPGGRPDNLIQAPVPTSVTEAVTTGRNLSVGRYREVDIVIIRPAGVLDPIPVCVALHAGLAGAKSFISLGVPDMLTRVVKEGARPFAIAAVDGGNWVGYKDDDPQRMLQKDLPDWLDRNNLAPTPFAAIGLGEGGAGALTMARTGGFTAVAAISPHLFTSWADAKPSEMFEAETQWQQREPLRHVSEYANMAVGVWCGTEDRKYIGPSRTFAQQVKAAHAVFTPGAHDNGYWRGALSESLKFVGGVL